MDIKRTVFIVDDDLGFRKTLSNILKVKGYAPVAIDQGQTALDRVKTESPSAAVIDLKLDDMSGLTLMKEIKKLAPSMIYTGINT